MISCVSTRSLWLKGKTGRGLEKAQSKRSLSGTLRNTNIQPPHRREKKAREPGRLQAEKEEGESGKSGAEEPRKEERVNGLSDQKEEEERAHGLYGTEVTRDLS